MSSISATDTTRRTIEDYLAAQETRSTGEMGKTEFLNLLVAQLANQDPLEPAKDTEFIAQLAQFSTLEQMQMLSQSYANAQASSMIGKYIEGYYTYNYLGTDASGNQEIRQASQKIAGLVSGLTYVNGEARLQIQGLEGYTVALSDVEIVMDYEAVNGLDFNSSVLDSSSLIGKYVKAEYKAYGKNDDGTVNLDDEFTKKVEGYVDRISVEGGVIYAHIGEDRFDVRSILDIALSKIDVSGDGEEDSDPDIDPLSAPDPASYMMQSNQVTYTNGIEDLIAAMDTATLQNLLLTLAQNLGMSSYDDLLDLVLRDPALLTDGISLDGAEAQGEIGPDEFGNYG